VRGLWLLALSALIPALCQAAAPLPDKEAAAWLQKVSDASRHMSYEGVFVFQHGGQSQTLMVSNRPSGGHVESRMLTMDGKRREVPRMPSAGATCCVPTRIPASLCAPSWSTS
jgi:sigma-E factor negative regulatory protein RseB